jgi:hypothetical protein
VSISLDGERRQSRKGKGRGEGRFPVLSRG